MNTECWHTARWLVTDTEVRWQSLSQAKSRRGSTGLGFRSEIDSVEPWFDSSPILTQRERGIHHVRIKTTGGCRGDTRSIFAWHEATFYIIAALRRIYNNRVEGATGAELNLYLVRLRDQPEIA